MARLSPLTPSRLQGSLSHWQHKLRFQWHNTVHSLSKRHPLSLTSTPPPVDAASPHSSLPTRGATNRKTFKKILARERHNHPIYIQHLDKIFNVDQNHPCHALKDISLTIPQGSVQMLVGPSGAGKTTFLLCLAGLLQPTNGSITMLGQCLNDLSPAQMEHFRRQHIGMVFQESNLLRSLTALENVEAMLQFRGVQGHAAHRQAQDLLDAVGLHTHLDHLPRHLSGGQQQRVSVARALAGYPPIILADEPTAALDSKTGHKVVEFMRHMAKDHGCIVIVTTHDTRILDVGDRTGHLHDGILSDKPLLPSR